MNVKRLTTLILSMMHTSFHSYVHGMNPGKLPFKSTMKDFHGIFTFENPMNLMGVSMDNLRNIIVLILYYVSQHDYT